MPKSRSARSTKLRTHLASLFAHSTVHGISHAASAPSRMEKTFWLGLVLGGLATFVANVSLVTDRYLRFPVLTAHHPARDAFVWPDVTFCDNTPVLLDNNDTYWRFQTAINQLVADPRLQNLTALMDAFLLGDPRDRNHDEMLNTLSRSMVLSTLDNSVFNDTLPRSLLAVVYYKLHNELIQSEVNIDSNWLPLSESGQPDAAFYSASIVMRFRCACHTLRLSEITKRQHLKAVDSLQFVIKGNYLTYLRFNSSNYQFGGRVFIHQAGTLPEDGRQFETPPGVATTVFLAQHRHQLLPAKSNCRHEVMSVPVYDYFMREARLYNLSYSLCHQVLSQTIFYSRCGCYNPHLILPQLDSRRPVLCFNVTEFGMDGVERNLRCLSETAKFYRNESNFSPLLQRRCANLKRPRCDSLTWDVDSQRELYREMWAEEANPARMNFISDVLRSVIGTTEANSRELLRRGKLEVSNLILTATSNRGDVTIEEAEYPLSQFLSDIGGLMGLYLGVSVVGLCELLEVLALLLKTLLCQSLPQLLAGAGEGRNRRGRGGGGDDEGSAGSTIEAATSQPDARIKRRWPLEDRSSSCGEEDDDAVDGMLKATGV